MGRFSEQERALVRAWRKANQAEREALEAAVRRILTPVTPQIQYEMRAGDTAHRTWLNRRE